VGGGGGHRGHGALAGACLLTQRADPAGDLLEGRDVDPHAGEHQAVVDAHHRLLVAQLTAHLADGRAQAAAAALAAGVGPQPLDDRLDPHGPLDVECQHPQQVHRLAGAPVGGVDRCAVGPHDEEVVEQPDPRDAYRWCASHSVFPPSN